MKRIKLISLLFAATLFVWLFVGLVIWIHVKVINWQRLNEIEEVNAASYRIFS